MLFEHHYLKSKFYKTSIIDALYFFAVFLYLSFLSPYLSSLGWSEALKGWFFSLFAIIGVFLSPAVGALSDAIGRYKVLVLGFALEILSLTIYVLFTNTTVLFSVRVLGAIAFNMVTLSALSRIHDTVANNTNRSKVSGLFHSILAISALGAPLVGGFLADNYGYTFVFLIAALFLAVVFFGMIVYDFFFYTDNYPHRKKQKLKLADLNPFLDAKELFQYKQFRSITFVGMLTSFSSPIMTLILPFVIVSHLGLSNQHLSIAVFLFAFAHIFQYYLGMFADRIGTNKGIYVGLSIMVLCFSLFFLVNSYIAVLLFVVSSSLGASLWNVAAWSYMSDIGEKHNIEGKLVGTYASLARIPVSLSFIVTGFLLTISYKLPFVVYAVLIVIGLLSQRKVLLANTSN